MSQHFSNYESKAGERQTQSKVGEEKNAGTV